ncbi:hypothetical protein K458DRAFT_435087 [Lentithecium fluviatile CBS 122367]|uniref:Polyketide cyclase/dehydrase n=1 Tax=Lentithecium fluviatile CBS 122367 TaxID=1168545 RepID=A0A6G1IMZ5_9PLEO|nr:hypothetical protein K458DRAFT_435087 [Lentithecium fluviatile CBS 122367]
MGAQHIYTSIEIAAPPAEVRKKFLAWDQLQTYSPNGFIRSIAPADPAKPLEPGDKLIVQLKGISMKPTFLESSPTLFRWAGAGLGGTFNGEHIFRFEASDTTPGRTTFVQEEVFDGAMAWLIGEGWVAGAIGFRKSTVEGFKGFNADLKRWCEGRGE